MDNKQITTKAKQLIAQNKMVPALDLLREAWTGGAKESALISILARYNELTQKEMQGLLDDDDASRRLNNIRSSLLQLINMKEEDLTSFPKENASTDRTDREKSVTVTVSKKGADTKKDSGFGVMRMMSLVVGLLLAAALFFFGRNYFGSQSNENSDTTTAIQKEQPVSSENKEPIPVAKSNNTRTNLLTPENGCEIVMSTQESLAKLINGEEYGIDLYSGDEIVFNFKNEGTATFDMFTTFVGQANDGNTLEYILSASSDAPSGPFEIIDTFKIQNARLPKTPYQELKFSPVTAKYFKVKLMGKTANCYASEIQLFGILN